MYDIYIRYYRQYTYNIHMHFFIVKCCQIKMVARAENLFLTK